MSEPVEHIKRIDGPLSYPGGKDGMYVGRCSCGYNTAPHGTPGGADKPLSAHVKAKGRRRME